MCFRKPHRGGGCAVRRMARGCCGSGDAAEAGRHKSSGVSRTTHSKAAAVGSDGAAGFVVVWDSPRSSGSDTSGFSIQGQHFGEDDIFTDGFESGDTLAWSSVVL